MKIKKFFKKLLERLGIVAFKRSSRVYIPEDDSYRIVASLLDRTKPVIIDGGAHLGDVPEKLSEYLPDAEYHCFEPDPLLGKTLDAKFAGNRRVKIVHAALGETVGKARFNINQSRATNSLLPTSDRLQTDLRQLCKSVEQIEVDVLTLDDYCQSIPNKKVDLIKLDLQGYDLPALKGAKETLSKVQVVLVEVLFSELYRGCHLFPDMLNFMLDNGFSLYTLCGLHYGCSDELLWADAVFVDKELSRRYLHQNA